MSANADIALLDGKGTPETHTFIPMGIEGKVSRYSNVADSSYQIGRETLSFSVKDKAKVRVIPVTLRIPRLIEETINSITVPSVPDFMTVKAEIFVPHTWAEADIKDGRILASNALLNTLVAEAIDTGVFVY